MLKLAKFSYIAKKHSPKEQPLAFIKGEIYAGEHSHRYRLRDTPSCINCDEIDTWEHKLSTLLVLELMWDRVT